MNKSLLADDYIQIAEKVSDWKNAIILAAQPMIAHGDIVPKYVDAMIQTVNELGSYIVIAPNIALPHARGAGNVMHNSISLLKLKQPVYFSDDEDSRATIILPIACKENEDHLAMLAAIAEMFQDEELISKLIKTDDVKQLRALLKNFKI